MCNHIPELKGIDAEKFLEILNRDITEDEIKAVREWALSKDKSENRKELYEKITISHQEYDKAEMNQNIDTRIFREYALCKHFEDYNQEHLERCACGSSLFRIYNEPVKEGQYEQIVCAVCNSVLGGWLNDFNTQLEQGIPKGVSGRICRKCGDELR